MYLTKRSRWKEEDKKKGKGNYLFFDTLLNPAGGTIPVYSTWAKSRKILSSKDSGSDSFNSRTEINIGAIFNISPFT